MPHATESGITVEPVQHGPEKLTNVCTRIYAAKETQS